MSFLSFCQYILCMTTFLELESSEDLLNLLLIQILAFSTYLVKDTENCRVQKTRYEMPQHFKYKFNESH